MSRSSGCQNARRAAGRLSFGAACVAVSERPGPDDLEVLARGRVRGEPGPEWLRARRSRDRVAIAHLDQHARRSWKRGEVGSVDQSGREDAEDGPGNGKPPAPCIGGVVEGETGAVRVAGGDDGKPGQAEPRKPVLEPSAVGDDPSRAGLVSAELVAREDHRAPTREQVVEPRPELSDPWLRAGRR